jgi:hypothetical protein
VSVVIVPGSELGSEALTALLTDIRDQLEPVRLLTTRLHVVGPHYLWVSLGATIRTQPEIAFGDVQTTAIEQLQQYFNPLPGGGPQREGWPFGRAIYLSEIYEQLESVDGVDYVQDVRVLHVATSGEAISVDRTAVGIQIGLHSTVGIDSRLGGDLPAEADRLIRDASGRLMAVALRPYELVRIVVQARDLLSSVSLGRMPSAPRQNQGESC